MVTENIKVNISWLLFISSTIKFFGIVVLVGSIVLIGFGIHELSPFGDEGLGKIFLSSGIGGFFMIALPFLAVAELIKVFINIEYNTRKESVQLKIEMDKTDSKRASEPKITFDEWKKENPTRPIEDFYKELAKE